MYPKSKKRWGTGLGWALLAGADLPLPMVDERGSVSCEGSHLHFSKSPLQPLRRPGSSMPPASRQSPPPSSSAGLPPEAPETAQKAKNAGDGKLDLGFLKSVDLVAFNQSAETAFVRIVTAFLSDEGQPQPVKMVLAEAAFELDISTETAKRYLLKHSARRAEFRVDGMGVWLR